MRISAIMIVKDEAAVLHRCLSSIEGLFDELIVVDTGSTDATEEIASKHGAQIHHHPWEDNFSKHRNQSIQYATGDWLFIIDADEELIFNEGNGPKELRAALESLKKDKGENALAMQVQDIQDRQIALQFNSPRFFRAGTIRFEGRIHEEPRITDAVQMIVTKVARLHHSGYTEEVMIAKDKYDRTERLLLKSIKENPKYISGFHYLCQLYGRKRWWMKCIKYGEKYLKAHGFYDQEKGHSQRKGFNPTVFFTLANAFLAKDDSAGVERMLHLAVFNKYETLDVFAAMVEYGVRYNKNLSIVVGAQRYLELYNKLQNDPSSSQNAFVLSGAPWVRAHILYHLTLANIQNVTASHLLFDKSLETLPLKAQQNLGSALVDGMMASGYVPSEPDRTKKMTAFSIMAIPGD